MHVSYVVETAFLHQKVHNNEYINTMTGSNLHYTNDVILDDKIMWISPQNPWKDELKLLIQFHRHRYAFRMIEIMIFEMAV